MSNIEGLADIKSEDVLTYFNTIFDKPVLLIWPLGVKGSEQKGWKRIRYEDTQTVGYKRNLAQAVQKGGNIGISLGPISSNLVTLDLDTDEERDRFLEFAPWACETLISVGSDGCQCWFYIDGIYPNRYGVWKRGGTKNTPVVEFRTNVQSIIWGLHPETRGRYTNNGKKPLHVSYYDLKEYHSFLVEQGGGTGEDVWRPGQTGDWTWTKKYKGCILKDLDLLGMLKEAGIRIYERIEKSEEGTDRYAIPCPWVGEHTTENNKRDAMAHMFEPRGKWWPAFTCFHAHCADKGLKDLLEWLEKEHGLGPSVVHKHCDSEKKLIEIVDYSDLIEAPPLPEPIIDGLLYPELKMLIASSAKIGKTWLGIDLALSLAAGIPWMGFDTCQSKVMYLNMEMAIPWFLQRICLIKRAKGILELPSGSIMGANLRGSRVFVRELDPKTVILSLDPLYDAWKKNPFDVIVYDPIYKFLGASNLDENKASDVAKLLGMMDDFGRDTKVASVLIHHYAKGDAWLKKAGDRASGSGVFLRDPDTYIAITSIGEEDSGEARVDCRLRCAPPVEPFGIRWNDYEWKRDAGIEIKKKQKESKIPKVDKAALISQLLKDNPRGLTATIWKDMAMMRGIVDTEANFYKLRKQLEDKGLLRQDELKRYFIKI